MPMEIEILCAIFILVYVNTWMKISIAPNCHFEEKKARFLNHNENPTNVVRHLFDGKDIKKLKLRIAFGYYLSCDDS